MNQDDAKAFAEDVRDIAHLRGHDATPIVLEAAPVALLIIDAKGGRQVHLHPNLDKAWAIEALRELITEFEAAP